MEPSSNEKMSRSRLRSRRKRKIPEDKKLSTAKNKKRLLLKSEEESEQQNKFEQELNGMYADLTIARENLRTKSNVTKSGLQALIKSKGFEPPKLSEAKTVFVKEWNRVKEMKNWKRTVFFDKIIDTDENFDFDY